jgi:glyoxylase-like metal-dependent hydrolase (beta-lactamase superfamily II)
MVVTDVVLGFQVTIYSWPGGRAGPRAHYRREAARHKQFLQEGRKTVAAYFTHSVVTAQLGPYNPGGVVENDMFDRLKLLLIACVFGVSSITMAETRIRPVPIDSESNLFVWTDTCNVYVLRDGDAAVLIDLGDGSVLDHLGEIGVRRVEWVLFTHHHREQCQGVAKLAAWKPQIAAPEIERALFEEPTRFRKAKPTLADAFTVHGASYVRPPMEPIRLNRTFKDLDVFTWRGWELRCLDTKGNSPGGMSYLWKLDGRWVAFSGDVMLDGARMHTWFDTEWDYGFAKGLYELIGSVSLLQSYDPAYLLPAHGKVIVQPTSQLQDYQDKLRKLAGLYVRGHAINTFGAADQDTVSKPTSVPYLWRVTKHLYKFKKKDFWPNFGILVADNGHALVFDCGLIGRDLLERSLAALQRHCGLQKIDAVLITHMHGDHFLDVPYLREKWGTQVWTLKDIASVCEHPERYDYAAMIPAYQAGFDSLRIDRHSSAASVSSGKATPSPWIGCLVRRNSAAASTGRSTAVTSPSRATISSATPRTCSRMGTKPWSRAIVQFSRRAISTAPSISGSFGRT